MAVMLMMCGGVAMLMPVVHSCCDWLGDVPMSRLWCRGSGDKRPQCLH